MPKLFKNKIFATLAVTAIALIPFVSAADHSASGQNDNEGFFSNTATVLSAIKEDSKALVSDTSSGGAILFGSLKDVFDKVAQSFYLAVSSLLPDKTDNQELITEETTTKKAPTNKFLSFIGDLFSGVKEGVLSIFSQEEPIQVATEEPKIEITPRIKEPIPPKTITESINQPIAQSQSGSPKIIERVIERVIEKVPAEAVATAPAASSSEVDSKLEQLKNKVFSEIYRVSASTAQPIYQAISLTNKIDNLNGVTISNSTVSGTLSGLTDSMVPDSITVSNYLPLSGGTLTGALTTYASATSTFAGQSLFSFVPSVVHTFSSWATGVAGANPLGAALIVNPASATADSNLLSLSVGNSAKFLIDAEGDVFANSLTASGGVTLSTTTTSTFSVENNATFGDATTTDKTYFNSRIGSSLIPTTNNLLDIGDTVNGLAWRTGIFGTSIGIGTTSPYAALSVVGETVSTYFTATSTTATSTFMGAFSIGSTTPSSSALFSVGTSSPLFLVNKNSGNVSINNILSILGTGTSTIAGDFHLTGASSTIKFGNSWRITPTIATTSELTVYDSSGNAAFVFDEN